MWKLLMCCALTQLLFAMKTLAHGHSEQSVSKDTSETWPEEIHMLPVHPKQDDEYWCASQKVPSGTSFITQFEALSSMDTVHHMILFGCQEPIEKDQRWDCSRLCSRGESKIMFAWARNAPPTRLPEGVGFEVGPGTDVNYFVLQLHYKTAFTASQEEDTSGLRMTMTRTRQKYEAGVMILLAGSANIPAHTPDVHVDVSCQYEGKSDIYPFAFRVHSHDLGTVISAYQNNGTWNEMGKGNPQWPQAFYQMTSNVVIKNKDFLVARCTFDASQRNRDTSIGSTHNDEMCNFYFMYYTEGDSTYLQCVGDTYKRLSAQLPADSSVPPPRRPELEEEGHHHHLPGHQEDQSMEDDDPIIPVFSAVPTWHEDAKLGQVAGIAVDSKGNLHVFHRGSREWDGRSFDRNNVLLETKPIKEDVLVTFDPEGKIIDRWGADMFYMPHGLSLDADDNLWVTDVGMHQVLRFPPGSHTADRILGQRMRPGQDQRSFCQPSDVAVVADGCVFITDGYCNSRVVVYSSEGQYVTSWGTRSKNTEDDGFATAGTFDLPHSITDLPDKQQVCVADRQNKRIQCFDYDGTFVRQYHPTDVSGPLYAVAYCQEQGALVVVNSDDGYGNAVTVRGFTMRIDDGRVLQTFKPTKGFSRPHDLAVTSNCSAVYVSDIGNDDVYKFAAKPGSDASRLAGHPDSVDNSTTSDSEDRVAAAASGDSASVASDLSASVILVALLVVPVLVIVVIVVFLRVRKQRPVFDLNSVDYKLIEDRDSPSSGDEEDEVWVQQTPNGTHSKKVHFNPVKPL